jgi:hypothetical protein
MLLRSNIGFRFVILPEFTEGALLQQLQDYTTSFRVLEKKLPLIVEEKNVSTFYSLFFIYYFFDYIKDFQTEFDATSDRITETVFGAHAKLRSYSFACIVTSANSK